MAFLWVYKLIWENTKIISNSYNYTTANILFEAFEECIKFNSWNINISSNKTFYIWLSGCNISNTKTWITLNNINYILYWSWKTNNKYDLTIIFEWNKIKKSFLLK
jgi:hypothetical protein